MNTFSFFKRFSVFSAGGLAFGLALACFAVVCSAGCKRNAAAEADSGGESTPKPIVEVTLAKVRRQTVLDTINVTGSLSPLPDHESKVSVLAPGRIKNMFVKLGDQVVKGQPIAELDPGALLGQVQQAQATVRSDQETLRQARLNYNLQVKTQAATVAQAEQNMLAQRVALQKLLAGSRPQEIAQAQANVNSAQAALTNAEQNLARSQTLAAEGLLAKKDLEAAQAQEASAKATLLSAQEALSLVKAGNRPQDILGGRIAVQQAQEQVAAARAGAIQNNVKAQDVRIAQQNLESAQGAYHAAQAQLTAAMVRAPISGTIVGRPLNVGEWADTSAAVAQVADISELKVLLTVPAAQIAKVRPGLQVEFTNDSGPSHKHFARVSLVGRAVDPATNTIPVEATADNRDRSLRDDGFVHAVIILGRHVDVTVVPSQAVVDKDGKSTVFVVGKDNVAHAKEVQVGLSEGGVVEVVGVKEGDQVVASGAYELDDGTQVKTAATEGEASKDEGK